MTKRWSVFVVIMSNSKILISGSLAFDVIFSIPIDFRKSIPLDNGKIRSFNASYTANGKNEFPGGTGGNICFWIGQEKIPCSLFSAWGKDFSEKKYRQKLENLGVEIRGKEGDFTAHAYMISDPLHQQLIIWQPNAYKFHDEIALVEYFSKKELESFEYALFGAGSPKSIERHLIEFRQANKKALVIFDPGQVTPIFSKKSFQKCCKNSDILIGNDIEFRHFREMGIPENVMQIETLGKRGVQVKIGKNVVETLQCNVSTKSQIFPAEKVKKIVETTGAGDAFRAGFLSGLAQGMKFDEAIQNGTKLGAKCVMLPSGQF